ncbi:MAG: hypothetical protein AAFZ11_05435 [Pseudomonadota bacterium]
MVGAAVLALGVGVLAASQTLFFQRILFALSVERVYDRYEQTDTTQTDVTARVDASGREAALVSAFFGLDQGLPDPAADWAVCEGAGGADGMPVIFSHEVDVTTLEPGDFKINQRSGAISEVTCLTLAPADDPGELRTALLAGQFGDLQDQAVTVEVIGDVLSRDGSVTFKGAQVDVTPLEDGPSLVFAEAVPEDEWSIGQKPTSVPFGGGSGCPEGTQQVVRATWNGGITKPNNTPAGDKERALYEVVMERANGDPISVTPIALADTGDGDNNHKLCLDTSGRVQSIRFPAGYLTDPGDDLNPATQVELQP